VNKGNLKILIGGTASSGSSLLAHLLNTHSKIYCGAETNLFTNYSLQNDWARTKIRLLGSVARSKIESSGWHVHFGVQLEPELNSEIMEDLVKNSESFDEFIDSYFEKILLTSGKKFAAEKTPSNSIFFHSIRQIMQPPFLLLTVRDPYDAIASMVNRGWTVAYSAALYLFNISMGLTTESDIKVIKYEDLANRKNRILAEILGFIGLELDISQSGYLNETEKIESWSLKPSGPIVSHNNTFDRLPGSQKITIHSFIQHLRFKDHYTFYGQKPRFRSIPEMMVPLDYNARPNIPPDNKIYLKSRIFLEKVKRQYRGFQMDFYNFPFQID
jgi:hypothetical protein